MTPTNPQQEAQTSEARPASKSALEAARTVLYPFRGLISEQQVIDAAGVIDEQTAAPDMLSALKQLLEDVAGEQRDPEELRKSLGIHAANAIAQADAAIAKAEKQP